MRENWEGNTELQRRLLASPPQAREIVELLRSLRSDIKDAPDRWQEADSLSGITLLADGGVKLQSQDTTRAEFDQGTDGVIGPLQRDPPFHVLQIDWKTPAAAQYEIDRLVARLHPNADGSSGVDVEEWRLMLFRLAEVGDPTQFTTYFDFQPLLGTPARAPVVGSTPSNVVFDLRSASASTPVRVGPPPTIRDNPDPLRDRPITIALIWGVKGEGELAENTAWVGESTAADHDQANYTAHIQAYQRTTIELEESEGTRFVLGSPPGGVPQFELISGSYTEQTISFTAAGNRLDLGEAPEEALEVVARGQTPRGTSLTYEFKVPTASTWFEVADGDLIGEDNTPTGGNDLTSLPKRPDYDARVTLTPNNVGSASPIVRRFGVDDRASEILDGEATVRGYSSSVDVPSLKGEIGEVQINVLKTGIRDYRDVGTEILAANHLGELEARIWIGHPDLARRHWLHVDSFLIEDYDTSGAAIHLQCVTWLAKLKAQFPPFDPVQGERTPIQYENDTLKAVYEDLLTGRIDLPARVLGPVVEDDETLVTKLIQESVLKDEMDAVAYLAGGAVISSQGRIKFVGVMDQDDVASRRVVEPFEREVVTMLNASPGYANRVSEMFVPFSWQDGQRTYRGESRAIHTLALVRLPDIRLEPPLRLDDQVAQWIIDEQLADRIGVRTVTALGVGRIFWDFRTRYPAPWLEVGDVVAVQTDQFVAKDPITERSVRGMLWGIGVITQIQGAWGREFSVWMRGFGDLRPGDIHIDRFGYVDPDEGLEHISYEQGTHRPSPIGISDSPTGNLQGKVDPSVVSHVDVWSSTTEFTEEPTGDPDLSLEVSSTGRFAAASVTLEQFVAVRLRKDLPTGKARRGRFRLNVEPDARRLVQDTIVRVRAHPNDSEKLQYGVEVIVRRRVEELWWMFDWRDETTDGEPGGYDNASDTAAPFTGGVIWFPPEVEPSVDDVRVSVAGEDDPALIVRPTAAAQGGSGLPFLAEEAVSVGGGLDPSRQVPLGPPGYVLMADDGELKYRPGSVAPVGTDQWVEE